MNRLRVIGLSLLPLFGLAACTGEAPSPATAPSPDGGDPGGGESGCDDRSRLSDDIDRTLVAVRRSDEITVDGSIDEADFGAAPAIAFTDPEGDSENRVRAWAAWDPRHLHVAVEVEDDELAVADVSTHQNDGVELFLDTERDRSEQMHRDDHQWLIPIEGSPAARRGTSEGGTAEASAGGLTRAVERFDGGYRVEIEVSFAQLGVDTAEGQRLGLLVANNDRDGDAHVPFSWGGLFPFKEPSGWGDLRLAGVRCGAEPAPVEDEACPFPPEGDYGADANDTCDPVGGGEGYTRVLTGGDRLVATRAELLDALEDAGDGDIVYVDDDAEIELQGSDTLSIPGGVTMASGRGHEGSEGALLYSDDRDTPQLIETAGDRVRITGLRIRGPYTGTDRIDQTSRGIRSSSSNHVEIDNCEIWGFTHYATSVNRGHVHHNDIHHNRRGGLGYGVITGGAPGPLIEANRFDYNRHSIAAPGCADCRYEARFNHVGPNRNGHAFDLHETRCETDDDGEYLSGEQVLIHHNTFLGDSGEQPVGIRGNPRSPSEVHHNWFVQRERPVTQKNGTKRLESYRNQVGPERELLEDGPPVYHWTGSVGACE